MKALKLLARDPRFRALTVLAAFLAVIAALATGSSPVFAKALGAGLAVGLAGIGGGYAVGIAGAAAVSAVAENREISGTVLLYVALGEGIAIYGLLVALIILFVL